MYFRFVALFLLASFSGGVAVSIHGLNLKLESAGNLLKESVFIDSHGRTHSLKYRPLQAQAFSLDPERLHDRTGLVNPKSFILRNHSLSVTLQLWSAHVPCQAQYKNSVRRLMEALDILKRSIGLYPNDTHLATSYKDVLANFQKGIKSSFIGIDGGHALGNSMAIIRAVYELGVRFLTLTHNCHTPWAESRTGDAEFLNSVGLTDFGKKMVLEINRVGILIDLSHSSEATAYDVLNSSIAPVAFFDGVPQSLCQSYFGISDEILRFLASKEGIVMLSFEAIANCHTNATVRDVIGHLHYLRSAVGVDSIGFGSGYNKIQRISHPSTVEPSIYEGLFTELLKDASWAPLDIRKIAGLNFLRILQKVEQVKNYLRSESPGEDIIPIHDIDSKWPCRYKFASWEEYNTLV